MTGKIELTKQALNEMEQATITPEEWCKRIQEGYPKGTPYKYKNTHNWKAQQFLFQAANTSTNPPPLPPKPVGDLSDVQRCLFLTNDISRALQTHDRLLIATADMRYREYYTREFLDAAISQNRLRVWCDCHSTMPNVALQWLSELGLPLAYFYGECESKYAFTAAYEGGARKMVGNLSVLTDDDSLQPNSTTNQLGLVRAGKVHVTNETYFNVNPNYPVDWRNANAGVGSNCMAVYESSSEGADYFSLRKQAEQNKYNPQTDCVYVAGLDPADWDFLIAN